MTHFCEQLCQDSEIWHILMLVRNELGILVEHYDHINISNASLQYYITY